VGFHQSGTSWHPIIIASSYEVVFLVVFVINDATHQSMNITQNSRNKSTENKSWRGSAISDCPSSCSSKPLSSVRDENWDFRHCPMNEEFPVRLIHQLTLITSLPFVDAACRYNRSDGLMRSSDQPLHGPSAIHVTHCHLGSCWCTEKIANLTVSRK